MQKCRLKINWIRLCIDNGFITQMIVLIMINLLLIVLTQRTIFVQNKNDYMSFTTNMWMRTCRLKINWNRLCIVNGFITQMISSYYDKLTFNSSHTKNIFVQNKSDYIYVVIG